MQADLPIHTDGTRTWAEWIPSSRHTIYGEARKGQKDVPDPLLGAVAAALRAIAKDFYRKSPFRHKSQWADMKRKKRTLCIPNQGARCIGTLVLKNAEKWAAVVCLETAYGVGLFDGSEGQRPARRARVIEKVSRSCIQAGDAVLTVNTTVKGGPYAEAA